MAKKESNLLRTVKELRKTERGKAILFLGIYFIFFFFLFIFINFGGKNRTFPDDYEATTSDTYLVDRILNGNYFFDYTIYIDGVSVIYKGKKNRDKELFTFNGNNYYYDGDSYFINSNDQWILTTDPYIFKDFIDFERLGEVIVDATYISKTEFDNGETLFNYQVSSNSLIKRLENIDTDISEVPNTVVFISSKEGEVYRAQLDFSSYGKYKGICNDSFNIVLEYSDFGNNTEIDNPLE